MNCGLQQWSLLMPLLASLCFFVDSVWSNKTHQLIVCWPVRNVNFLWTSSALPLQFAELIGDCAHVLPRSCDSSSFYASHFFVFFLPIRCNYTPWSVFWRLLRSIWLASIVKLPRSNCSQTSKMLFPIELFGSEDWGEMWRRRIDLINGDK